jgi:hypothetical protein
VVLLIGPDNSETRSLLASVAFFPSWLLDGSSSSDGTDFPKAPDSCLQCAVWRLLLACAKRDSSVGSQGGVRAMRIRWIVLAALMVAGLMVGLEALRSPQMQVPAAKVANAS